MFKNMPSAIQNSGCDTVSDLQVFASLLEHIWLLKDVHHENAMKINETNHINPLTLPLKII